MFRKLAFAASLFVSSAFAQTDLPKEPPKLKLTESLPANLFVELGRAINPAVVNISTSVIQRNQFRRDPMMDMLEQFYGIRRAPPEKAKPQKMGLGTGFIIREDGLIITNNHVIANADIINVQLSEKSQDSYEAKVIGSDDRTDIALIKINPKKKLPVAVLGSSTDLEVGEWVAAFGNPFGHGHSMSKGIVSSKERDITEINRLPLIQTDASINPGNSGGPLVNTKGLVVGVNSAIDARAQGIGFAIPIDEVKKLLPQLESKGRIARGYIGVYLDDLRPDQAEYLGLEEGVFLVNVEPNGPAAKAGLRMHDIILEFNGKEIKNSVQLSDAVAQAPRGTSVSVKVLRDRKKKSFTVTVKDRPDEKSLAQATKSKSKSEGLNVPYDFGFTISDPTPALQREFELAEDFKYPIVTSTERNGIASKAGLKVGDLILEVNKETTESAQEVLKALKKSGNTLRIARDGQMVILDIP